MSEHGNQKEEKKLDNDLEVPRDKVLDNLPVSKESVPSQSREASGKKITSKSGSKISVSQRSSAVQSRGTIRTNSSAGRSLSGRTGAPQRKRSSNINSATQSGQISFDDKPSTAKDILLEDAIEIPNGILPIYLSSETQKRFNCEIDETNANAIHELKYFLLDKQLIMHDLKKHSIESEFHVLEQHIEDYELDDLLTIYDSELKYGQNFFMAVTTEARDQLISENDITLEPEIHVYIPPVAKEWLSLGSELEVAEEDLVCNRKKVSMTVQRQRKTFGGEVNFSNILGTNTRNPCVEYQSYTDESFSIKQHLLNASIQAVKPSRPAASQTQWKFPRNASTQYAPLQLADDEKKEHLENKNLINFVKSSYPLFQSVLQQNNIMNIFYDDWSKLGLENDEFSSKSNNYLKEFQSFTDLKFSKRKTVTFIDWHPTIKGVIGVSLAERLSHDERIEHSAHIILQPSLILLWSFSDPIHPQLTLEAPDDIVCFKFNPTDPFIVAGGCINGQVVLWDISDHKNRLSSSKAVSKNSNLSSMTGFEEDKTVCPNMRYCAVSNIEYGHQSSITDIQWLPDHLEINGKGIPHENTSQTCSQLMSCAVDHCLQSSTLERFAKKQSTTGDYEEEEESKVSATIQPRLGSCLLWDIRQNKTGQNKDKREVLGVPTTFHFLDLTWRPLLKVYLSKTEPGGDHAALKFSFPERQGERRSLSSENHKNVKNHDEMAGFSFGRLEGGRKVLKQINTHLYIGTEDGELVYVDWMPQKDQETGKSSTPKPDFYHSVHDGPVTSLERSPFYRDILLSVGGWCFAIWKEGMKSGPILLSAPASKYLTGGVWSPSRPAVFFLSKQDGSVDIWDLLDRTHEPTMVQTVSPVQITTIQAHSPSPKQHFLSVGDNQGTLYILEIPWSLYHQNTDEESAVREYFNREVARREFVVARWDFREKEKIEQEMEVKRKAGVAPHVQLTDEEEEQRMKLEYKAFLDDENEFLRKLGLKEEVDEEISAI